jgi:hypothetical protein
LSGNAWSDCQTNPVSCSAKAIGDWAAVANAAAKANRLKTIAKPSPSRRPDRQVEISSIRPISHSVPADAQSRLDGVSGLELPMID